MTNVTQLEEGPQNFTKKGHEIIRVGRDKPADYIFLSPLNCKKADVEDERGQMSRLRKYLRSSLDQDPHEVF